MRYQALAITEPYVPHVLHAMLMPIEHIRNLAFEITYNGQLLHSKLMSKKWPSSRGSPPGKANFARS